jgi:hypothetical protein
MISGHKFLKSICVITSIFQPTSAVASFAQSAAFDSVLVVGDRKSPEHYPLEGVRFISFQEQKNTPWAIGTLLPSDHYARKMIGYLEAAAAGADVIFETDDDNRLISSSTGDIWRVECNLQIKIDSVEKKFVNIYKHFTDQFIWPRGLPLDCILDTEANKFQLELTPETVPVAVWQGLADGEPDVDAIYRLTSNQRCLFNPAPAVALAPGVVCPFNSQNTAFLREILPLMYLPAFVSFRYTDILRGLVAQPILWAAGLRLCFISPTVYQERNVHNNFKDFESEVSMYLTARRAIDTVSEAVSNSGSIPENISAAYAALEKAQIVSAKELKLLEAWLFDCDKALSPSGKV